MKNLLLTFVTTLLFLSPVIAQDLYDQETLRTIYIDFYQNNWHSELVDGWFEESGHRELATLEMDGVDYDSVAIRYKGNATFYWAENLNNPKLPLNIDMNDIVEDQDLLGYNKVKLANIFFDPSFVRDVLGFQIYRDYMPTPESNWVQVYVEDELYGVYANTESINRQFLEKHFDYKDGAFFKCDPSSQFGSNDPWMSPDMHWYGPGVSPYIDRYQLKSDEGWDEFVNLIDILNNNPEDVESVLNVDRVLWYLAVSTATANFDSYNGFYIHNYYFYQHENGLWQILPWDVSEVFVGTLLGTTQLQGDDVFEFDIFNEDDPFDENRALVNYVANHPLYRRQYLAHIRTVMEEVLDLDALESTVNNMHATIADAADNDNNAFWGLGNTFMYSNVNSNSNIFAVNVAGIVNTADKRKQYLEAHPEVSLTPPTINTVEHFGNNKITAEVTNGNNVEVLISTNDYASHFQAYPMFDDGQHDDGNAGDGIFGTTVPDLIDGTAVKYYIRAQNDDAMMLSPQRAEYEFYEFTAGQSTAVTNIEVLPTMQLTPNPSSGLVRIQMDAINFSETLTINIYNALGEKIRSENYSNFQKDFNLDASELANGVYYIQADGFATAKLIISK